MNELVKKLARTAEREVQISLGERWTTVGRAEFMRLYNEKFAELIIQECAWAADFAEDTSPGEYVKKHFGVE